MEQFNTRDEGMHLIVCCCFDFIIKSTVQLISLYMNTCFGWNFLEVTEEKKFHHFLHHLFFVSWIVWEFEWAEERENAEDGLRWRCSVLTKCDRINNGNCIASHSHTPPAVGLQTNVCVHVLNDCKYKVMSRPNGTSTVLGPLNLWSRYMVEEGIAVSPSRNNFMAASACLNMSLFIEYWDPSIRLWLQAKMTTRWNAWGRQGRVYLIFLFFFPCDLRHLRIKAQVKSGPFLHSHVLWLAAPSTRTDQE